MLKAKRAKVGFMFLLVLLIVAIAFPAHALERSPGDRLGDVLNTDIRVFINGQQIMGYNIDGWTYVVAEDLRAFGLSVHWDAGARTIAITRGPSTMNPPHVPDSFGPIGSIAFPYVYTDIITYIDGRQVQSYNIQGLTVVRLDDIAGAFGQTIWDSVNRILLASTDGSVPQGPRMPARPLRHVAPFFDRNPNSGSDNWDAIWFYDTVNMGGTTFDNPLNFRRRARSAGTQFTLHNLNFQYSTFSGLVGRVDGTRMDNVTINIIGDGRTLQTMNLRATDMPTPFSVSVGGVQQLRIEVVFPADTSGNPRVASHARSTRYAIVGYLE